MNTSPGASVHKDMPCLVLRLGLVGYTEAWAWQQALAEARRQGRVDDLLLLLEHPHIYTLGRRSVDSEVLLSEAELRERGVGVHRVDRGGQTTYHGPGQLVAYGVVDIRRLGGPIGYVRGLEEVVLGALGEFGIQGRRLPGLPGVWVGEEKIAAIGIRVSRGVTTHGFALNVSPDLTYFSHIVPCGILDREVTSMARVLGEAPAMEEVQEVISRHWGRVFGRWVRACAAPRRFVEQVASQAETSVKRL